MHALLEIRIQSIQKKNLIKYVVTLHMLYNIF